MADNKIRSLLRQSLTEILYRFEEKLGAMLGSFLEAEVIWARKIERIETIQRNDEISIPEHGNPMHKRVSMDNTEIGWPRIWTYLLTDQSTK